MIKRWCAAGMLYAERSFRRLKGFRRMPSFVAAPAVTPELLRGHAMLRESPERTNGRPTAQWSRFQAGRSGDLGPKS